MRFTAEHDEPRRAQQKFIVAEINPFVDQWENAEHELFKKLGISVFRLRRNATSNGARGSSMVASETFAEFLREHLAPLGRVTMRRMFGKTGVFCDGAMFAVVTENTLYVRVDDQNRVTFKEAESFPPLNYAKKGLTIDLAFWRVPERLFDDPDELVTWARAALAAAHRVAAKRTRTVSRRKSRRQRT